MKNVLIGLVLTLVAQTAYSFERPFRIDRYSPVTQGYAIAWGIPGKSLDFEFLDTLSYDQIETALDFSAVRNFVVDVESNKILTTVGGEEDREDYVVFNVGDIHYGNHYSLSLDKLAILNLPYDTDALAMTENFKWSNNVSTIILINRETRDLKTLELDAAPTMELLHRKLKESILPVNMDLFENAAENISFGETVYTNDGEMNVISFDYAYPKEDKNALAVTATVKLKYENGKVVPYILKVTQRQY